MDIDKHLSASGVLKLIEMKRMKAEMQMKDILNSNGVPKPGRAVAARGCERTVSSAITVTKWIKDYLDSVEE